MLRITDDIALDEAEIDERFIRASGPGGQNVNKVSSAVQLRFDVRGSPSLPAAVKARLAALAGRRLTKDGVLVLTANAHRTQERNRQDARDRLAALVRQASVAPVPRRETKPSYGQRQRRADAKSRRGRVKAMRRRPAADD